MRPRRHRCSWINPPAALSGPSAARDADRRFPGQGRRGNAQRAEERLVRDEAEVSRAIQRLSDAAALRAPRSLRQWAGPRIHWPVRSRSSPHRRFNLRLPQDDDHNAFVIDRLERFGSASELRFRPIALESGWWERKGPLSWPSGSQQTTSGRLEASALAHRRSAKHDRDRDRSGMVPRCFRVATWYIRCFPSTSRCARSGASPHSAHVATSPG